MIEDMKGKIRVYCRVRPLSKSELGMVTIIYSCVMLILHAADTQGCLNITESPDEYSINVHSSRGLKEFQFDRIFLSDHGQETVFEDTHVSSGSRENPVMIAIFLYRILYNLLLMDTMCVSLPMARLGLGRRTQ